MDIKKATILYVDDDKNNLKLFYEWYCEEYIIKLASSGAEGLDIYKESNQEIDLVFSDLLMPGMTGLEFFSKIIEINPEPPRILITAHGELQDLKLALNEYKISYFVQKPWSNAELQNVIKHSLSNYYLTKENRLLTEQLKAKTATLEKELGIKNDLLTKLEKSTAELAKSEDKYRVIAENTNDVIWTMDIEGKFIYVSPSVFKLNGYTPEELLKTNSTEYLSPESSKTILNSINNFVKSVDKGKIDTEPEFYELEQITKEGKTVFIEVTINKLFDSDNNFKFFLGVSRDISEKTKTKRMLEASEEKFSKMFQLSPDAILLTKLKDGEIVDANNKACELTEYTRDELIGNSTKALPFWKDFRDRENFVDKLLKTGYAYNLESIIVTKSGNLRTCIISGERIDLASGTYIMGIIHDITIRKRTENALQESKDLFKAIIDQTEEGILMLDDKNRIILCNNAILNLTDYEEDELISMQILDLFDPIIRDTIAEELKNYRSIQREVPVLNKKQNRIYTKVTGNRVEINKAKFYLFSITNINEMYLSEKALRRSEARLREAQKIAHIGHWRLDLSKNKLEWSDELYTMHSVSKSKFLPDVQNVIEFTHPDDREYVNNIYSKNIKVQPRFNLTHRIIDAKSQTKYVKQLGRIVRNKNEQATIIIGVTQDITEQVIAEKEIKKLNETLELKVKKRTSEYQASEKKFRDLLDFIPDGVAVINKYKKITFANRHLSKMLGFSMSELINLDLSEIIPDNSKIHRKTNQLSEQSISKGNYELFAQLKNGKIIQIDFRISTVFIENELNWICIIRDISVKKEREALLRNLNQALEQSPSSIVITDVNGAIEYVNSSFTKINQYTKDEVIGKNPRILKYEGDFNIDYSKIWQHILKGLKWEGDLPNKRKNGEFYWSRELISPIFDAENNIINFVSIQNDITEIKKAEEELRLAKKEAESANRAKSEFLANISHEIRTPLNAVLGMSELLTQQVDNSTHKSYLSTINSSGKILLSLINDVLDLSRIEAGKLNIQYLYINVKDTVEEIYNLLSLKALEKNIQFNLEIDPKIPDSIFLDELRFRQILINIINNAIKFTAKGSVDIILKASNTCAKTKKTDLEITIADTGIGISKKFLMKIFSPFSQQEGQDSRKFEGSGLGLAISKRLVDLMNGSIQIRSTPEIGTTFTIRFNELKCSSKQINTKPETKQVDKKNFKNCCVLIVDDNENNRKVIRQAFKGTKVQIIEAGDGSEAFNLLQTENPDLILTDIIMPVMDGHKLIEKIKNTKKIKDIPIIASSASPNQDHIKKLENAGVKDFLAKPIQLKLLYEIFSRYLPFEKEKQNADADYEEKPIQNFPDNPKLKEQLNGEIYELWKQLQKKQPMNIVSQFSDKLAVLGVDNEVEEIKIYSDKINEAIEAFDIDQILKLISYYPRLTGLNMQ